MKNVKLGDICNLMTGGTPSRAHKEYFEDGSIKWLVSGDIHKGEIYDCDGRITKKGLDNSNARILPVNSVMIALNGQGKTRATVALLRTEATCNQSLVSIYPKDDTKVLSEWIFWNLKGRYEELRRLTGDSGNDRRGLNMILIRAIEIPEPPSLDEQRRVVERLDAAFAKIDRAIELTERNISNAESLFVSVSKSILESGAGEEKRVRDILTLEYGKPLDKKDRDPKGKFAAYGANGVKDRTDKYYWDQPSIIVGRKGSAGELIRVDEPFWPLDVTYYVVHDQRETNIDYIFLILKTLDLPSFARGVKPGINRNDIYALDVAIPSIGDQVLAANKIMEIRKQTNSLIQQLGTKVNGLRDLKQALLTQAFQENAVK